MSMFVPKSWLNIRILLAGFKQLLRQTWDHQNIHTYPPLHFLGHRISSLKRRGVYLILGLLGAAFIRGGVYKRAVFIRGRRLFQEKIVF